MGLTLLLKLSKSCGGERKTSIGHICICRQQQQQKTFASSQRYTSAHTTASSLPLFVHILLHIDLLSSCISTLDQIKYLCVLCPVFSRCNKALIIESTQACLAELLLAPLLSFTSHQSLGCICFAHTYMQIHSCGHERKRDTEGREHFMGGGEGEQPSLSNEVKRDSEISTSSLASSSDTQRRLAGYMRNYANQILAASRMTDRFPHWQLACVGFSLAGPV